MKLDQTIRRRLNSQPVVSLLGTLVLGVATTRCAVTERDFSDFDGGDLGGAGSGDGDGDGSGDGDGDGDGDIGDGDTGDGDGDGDTGDGDMGDGDGDGDISGTGGTTNDGCDPYFEREGGDPDADCVCIEGHTGTDCTDCDDGYQDNDDDGSCQPGCGDDTCSMNGTCDDGTGTPVCTCEGLNAGDDCSRCTSGYERVMSGDCVWVGGIIQNGTFVDESIWLQSGDADINTAVGAGRLSPDAQCTGGRLSQEIELPDFGAGPPLILNLTAWAPSGFDGSSVSARVGDIFYDLSVTFGTPADTSVPNNSFCIGPGSLGGTALFEITPGSLNPSCFYDSTLIDFIEIVQDLDGVCATNTEIQNTSFNDTSAWTLSGNASIVGGNLELDNPNQCAGIPTARQALAVPTTAQVPGSAISVTYETGDGGSCAGGTSCSDQLRVAFEHAGGLGRQDFGAFRNQTGAPVTSTTCVPLSWRGTNSVLVLRNERGGCTAAYTYDSEVESVEMVDIPECVLVSGIKDGGFEAAGDPTIAWTYNHVDLPAASDFVKVTDMTAPEGMSHLVFGMTTTCSYPTIRTDFITPAATAEEKAAVVFQYRLPTPSQSGVTFNVCTEAGCQPLPEVDDWTEQVVCIDPYEMGEGFMNFLEFQGSATNGGGSCQVAIPLQAVEIDDIRVTTHASCN